MYFPIASSWVRAGLRVYFIVVLLYIAIIGDSCCHLRAKLQLLRGQKLSITAMTGWIRGISSFKIVGQLRRFPGGWLGSLMLLTAVLAIVSDLAVSAFVGYSPHASRCLFTQGMVLSKESAHWYPSITGAAYRWASTAQLISIDNGGVSGIYRKLDNNTAFLADEDDVVGYWSCIKNGDALSYTNTYDVDIWTDMYKRDLLYAGKNGWYTNISLVDDAGRLSGGSNQTIIMTASSVTRGDLWDIKAAIDMRDLDPVTSSKVMQAYHCRVTETDKSGLVTAIVQSINIEQTLSKWLGFFQGAMYNGQDKTEAVRHPDLNLEWMLNSMVMISGAGESITTDLPPGYTQGCVYFGTTVPSPVAVLFIIVGFLATYLTFYAIFLYFSIRRARKHYDDNNRDGRKVSSKELCDNVPNGLLDWMTHAAHESENAESRPKHRHLRKWLLSASHHDGRRMGVVQSHQADVPRSARGSVSGGLISPGSTVVGTPAPGAMSGYGYGYGYGGGMPGFMEQKMGYAAVSTREVR